jgi:clan AA aspartic protease (TIGR02281 family)
MNAKTLLFVLVISVFSHAANAEIYKCLTDGRDAKYQNSPCSESKQTEVKVNLPSVEHKQITLKQTQGHYFIAGEINGVKFPFMIDTGASFVVVSKSLADKAKINCSGIFVTMNTANGKVQDCVAYVEKLKIFPFELNNIEVHIASNLATESLLGMNVLQKFNIEQRNGEMHFSER